MGNQVGTSEPILFFTFLGGAHWRIRMVVSDVRAVRDVGEVGPANLFVAGGYKCSGAGFFFGLCWCLCVCVGVFCSWY